MPDELERRLERALSTLPGPSADAGEKALRASLDALPEQATARRWRAPSLLVSASLVVLAAAGVTLAATGSRPFSDVAKPGLSPTAAAHHARVAHGHMDGTVATYADGRLWLGRTRGRPFSAVELSPGALYAAVGRGHRLDVYTPDLRRLVWSRATAGPVVAIAWRPIGTQIAYVVHTAGGNVLHLIQADGDRDQVIDSSAAAVRPTWRWDSQALAYVGAGGHVALRDLVHNRARPVPFPGACAPGPASSVAFAPVGAHRSWVAGALPDGNAFAIDTADGRGSCFTAPPRGLWGRQAPPQVVWTPRGELLVAHEQYIARLSIVHGRVVPGGYVTAPRGVGALAAAPDGSGMLVALRDPTALAEVLAKLPPRSGSGPLHELGSLRRLPAGLSNGHLAARPELVWR